MSEAVDTLPRLISMRDTVAMTSLSRAQINKYRTLARFPQAVSLGEKRIAFVRSEVASWIEAKISARAAA